MGSLAACMCLDRGPPGRRGCGVGKAERRARLQGCGASWDAARADGKLPAVRGLRLRRDRPASASGGHETDLGETEKAFRVRRQIPHARLTLPGPGSGEGAHPSAASRSLRSARFLSFTVPSYWFVLLIFCRTESGHSGRQLRWCGASRHSRNWRFCLPGPEQSRSVRKVDQRIDQRSAVFENGIRNIPPGLIRASWPTNR